MVEIVTSYDPNAGGVAQDVANAIDVLGGTVREQEVRKLRSLWLDTFETQIASWSDSKVMARFTINRVWRVARGLSVFRTNGLPAIAFALARNEGQLSIVILGGCCDYPLGMEDEWWKQVIMPRIEAL